MASRHVDLRIPISVRNFTGRPVPALPYWTGVPLPRSTVAEGGGRYMLGVLVGPSAKIAKKPTRKKARTPASRRKR